ncbi:MAG TPA: helix-turn-helix domain-containing protein [bacterium]|nr:helix-turn-helix domain-containing protein [bacterium]
MLLRVPRVARVLDVHDHRVYKLIRNGVLPSVRLGRQVRVDEDALRDWIRRGGQSLPGGWRREPNAKTL